MTLRWVIGMSRLNWKMRQKVLKTWQKSTQIVLEFLKKCLKFKNSARNLLVDLNYFLADVQKIFLVLSRL